MCMSINKDNAHIWEELHRERGQQDLYIKRQLEAFYEEQKIREAYSTLGTLGYIGEEVEEVDFNPIPVEIPVETPTTPVAVPERELEPV